MQAMFDTYHNARRSRHEIVDWIDAMGFDHALTLNADRELSPARLKSIFSLFCKNLDTAAFGRNVGRVPTEQRLQAIGCPEHLSTNAHLHVAASLTHLEALSSNRLTGLNGLVREAWLQSTRGAGSIDLQPTMDRGWARYMTKDFIKSGGVLWHSAMFHPR